MKRGKIIHSNTRGYQIRLLIVLILSIIFSYTFYWIVSNAEFLFPQKGHEEEFINQLKIIWVTGYCLIFLLLSMMQVEMLWTKGYSPPFRSFLHMINRWERFIPFSDINSIESHENDNVTRHRLNVRYRGSYIHRLKKMKTRISHIDTYSSSGKWNRSIIPSTKFEQWLEKYEQFDSDRKMNDEKGFLTNNVEIEKLRHNMVMARVYLHIIVVLSALVILKYLNVYNTRFYPENDPELYLMLEDVFLIIILLIILNLVFRVQPESVRAKTYYLPNRSIKDIIGGRQTKVHSNDIEMIGFITTKNSRRKYIIQVKSNRMRRKKLKVKTIIEGEDTESVFPIRLPDHTFQDFIRSSNTFLEKNLDDLLSDH